MKAPAKTVAIRIVDIQGRTVELEGKKEAGLHRVSWNLTQTIGRARRAAPNGDYRVELVVDGKPLKETQTLTIRQDPTLSQDAIADEVFESQLLQQRSEADGEDEEDQPSEGIGF